MEEGALTVLSVAVQVDGRLRLALPAAAHGGAPRPARWLAAGEMPVGSSRVWPGGFGGEGGRRSKILGEGGFAFGSPLASSSPPAFSAGRQGEREEATRGRAGCDAV